MRRGSCWHTGMSPFLVDKHIFDLVTHCLGLFVEEKAKRKYKKKIFLTISDFKLGKFRFFFASQEEVIDPSPLPHSTSSQTANPASVPRAL